MICFLMVETKNYQNEMNIFVSLTKFKSKWKIKQTVKVLL